MVTGARVVIMVWSNLKREGIDMSLWKLMSRNDDGHPEVEVKVGDEVVTRDGEIWVVQFGVGCPPHKAGSTGRIWVETPRTDGEVFTQEFFPSVFDCVWVEEGS